MKPNDPRDLEHQIKEIKLQIAQLSTLLALKKLEEEHRMLEKLVTGAEQGGAAVKSKYSQLSGYAHQKLENVNWHKGLGIFEGVLIVGTIGYGLLQLLGLFRDQRR